jgi:hypothetical protein
VFRRTRFRHWNLYASSRWKMRCGELSCGTRQFSLSGCQVVDRATCHDRETLIPALATHKVANGDYTQDPVSTASLGRTSAPSMDQIGSGAGLS